MNVDEQVELSREYILSNGHELYQFFMDNLDSLEQVSNLIVAHWNKPNALSHCLKQQIENDVNQECGEKARERIYGE